MCLSSDTDCIFPSSVFCTQFCQITRDSDLSTLLSLFVIMLIQLLFIYIKSLKTSLEHRDTNPII